MGGEASAPVTRPGLETDVLAGGFASHEDKGHAATIQDLNESTVCSHATATVGPSRLDNRAVVIAKARPERGPVWTYTDRLALPAEMLPGGD